MTVSILGSGNLAWHLLSIFEEKGIRICELYARSEEKAKAISGYTYDVTLKTDLDFSISSSQIFIIAVSDDAIKEIAHQIILPDHAILVHTSGAKGMDELTIAIDKNPKVKLGVFYPLMSFTKGIRMSFEHVPFCIEGENESAFTSIATLALKVSSNVQKINSYQRSTLHLAAVYGANFVNHLLALSKEIMAEEGLDFQLLKPLLLASFTKALHSNHPAEVQTGPAIRRDENTLQIHKKLIADDEDLLKVYQVLSHSIMDWNKI